MDTQVVEHPDAPSRLGSVARRNMRLSCVDCMLWAVMVGLGESNFVLFALSLGISPVIAGLVGTVPLLIGAALQLLAPALVRRLASHQRLVCASVLVQILAFLPLIAGALHGEMDTLILFAVLSLYWAAGFTSGVGFTTMIAEMVPRRIRSRYFPLRSKWANATLVGATVTAGLLIDAGRGYGSVLTVFAVLFALAAAARSVSLRYLSIHTEHVPMPRGHRDVPLGELFTRFRAGPGGRLLIYMLAMQLAIQIFTPYLNPYLFEQLDLKKSFTAIALVNGAQIAAKVLFMPVIGRLAARHGPMRLLSYAAFAVVPLPLLWGISTSVPYLIVVQLVSGAALATYEMASLLLLFEAIPNNERTSVMVRYTVFSQAATAAGSFIGAAILESLGTQHAGYLALFIVSAACRLAAIPLMRRVTLPPHLPPTPETVQLRIHPAPGTMDEPELSSLADADTDKDEDRRSVH